MLVTPVIHTYLQQRGRSATTCAAHSSAECTLVWLLCMQVDDKPVSVCVLGWGPNSLMASLIKELDHGLSALPKGSEVSFVNMHSPHDSLGQALHNITLENVQVCCAALHCLCLFTFVWASWPDHCTRQPHLLFDRHVRSSTGLVITSARGLDIVKEKTVVSCGLQDVLLSVRVCVHAHGFITSVFRLVACASAGAACCSQPTAAQLPRSRAGRACLPLRCRAV